VAQPFPALGLPDFIDLLDRLKFRILSGKSSQGSLLPVKMWTSGVAAAGSSSVPARTNKASPGAI
jgi:hypothetical protein